MTLTSVQTRKEQVLDTAEDLLRRYGLAKTTVTDVARALGLTHAAVYKYFPTKAALREAVAARWLERVSSPLSRIAFSDIPAEERLRRWVHKLAALKRRKVLDDPELFATYSSLAESVDGAVSHHVATLLQQLEHILGSGFPIADTTEAAAAVLNATIRFHHPHFVREDSGRMSAKEIDAVLELIIAGLKRGVL